MILFPDEYFAFPIKYNVLVLSFDLGKARWLAVKMTRRKKIVASLAEE